MRIKSIKMNFDIVIMNIIIFLFLLNIVLIVYIILNLLEFGEIKVDIGVISIV